jgi:uncharacterized membrane protein YraQ (UPF0718 family)
MFKWFADLLTYDVFGLQRGARLADSVNFFIYDIPKIYFLLITVVFVVAIIRSFLPQERIKEILSHRGQFVGNIIAACLGIFIPFCTCSAIPLFIGMLESGVPLGITMSFLVSSPMINEIALILLWGLFGYKVALTYVASGLVIAVVSGFIIGKLKMENEVEELVRKVKMTGEGTDVKLTWGDRIFGAYEYTRDIFLSVWLYVMIGVGIGALIHGYIPIDVVSRYASKSNPFAVIIAVLLGVPLYANCAGAIPVVQAILEKGLPLGTSLAFLMGVTGLSLPEFIILRKVLKPKLLLTFFGTVAFGIVLVGYFFNIVF